MLNGIREEGKVPRLLQGGAQQPLMPGTYPCPVAGFHFASVRDEPAKHIDFPVGYLT